MNKFSTYKSEYSCLETTDERKAELLKLMQEDLKSRSHQEGNVFVCLDGVEHSVDSKNVEDLYAIDGLINFEDTREQQSSINDKARMQTQKTNKYGPNNPYPADK